MNFSTNYPTSLFYFKIPNNSKVKDKGSCEEPWSLGSWKDMALFMAFHLSELALVSLRIYGKIKVINSADFFSRCLWYEEETELNKQLHNDDDDDSGGGGEKRQARRELQLAGLDINTDLTKELYIEEVWIKLFFSSCKNKIGLLIGL